MWGRARGGRGIRGTGFTGCNVTAGLETVMYGAMYTGDREHGTRNANRGPRVDLTPALLWGDNSGAGSDEGRTNGRFRRELDAIGGIVVLISEIRILFIPAQQAWGFGSR